MVILYLEALVVIALSLSVLMAGAWLVQQRTGNSGWVDTIWTFSLGLVGAGSALWPVASAAPNARQWLVAALGLDDLATLDLPPLEFDDRPDEASIDLLATDSQQLALEEQLKALWSEMNPQIQSNKVQQPRQRPSDDSSNRPIAPIIVPSGSIIRDGKPISLAQRSDPAQLLVDMYNRNPSDLRKVYGVVPVSIPIDARSNLMGWRKPEVVILEKDVQGSYWVIQDWEQQLFVSQRRDSTKWQ